MGGLLMQRQSAHGDCEVGGTVGVDIDVTYILDLTRKGSM